MIDEERTIKGVTYQTIQGRERHLVRVARYDYDCLVYDHIGDKSSAIRRGDVYVEALDSGAQNSGSRFCQPCARRWGMLV